MKTVHGNRKSCTLIGLLFTFLLSAVVFPALGAEREIKTDNKVHLSTAADPHSSQGIPLTLLEEKEEEENRADKNHIFVLTLFSVVFERMAVCPAEPTTWAFNHTNTSAFSVLPIYLAQHLLLI